MELKFTPGKCKRDVEVRRQLQNNYNEYNAIPVFRQDFLAISYFLPKNSLA